jgi:hypothetical protein
MTKRGSIALLLLLACSGSKTQAPPAEPTPVVGSSRPAAKTEADPRDPPPNERETKHVAKTLARVSEIRGIKSTRTVPGVRLGRDELIARVKEKALREYPPEALKREGQLLQLVGFAPPTFDYLGEMMKLLEAQLEGFYEPKNGTMYLAADLHGKEAQATLAHELVHALQDQKWDLRSRSEYKPGKGDETMALAALAEGDATSVMMDFILREQGRNALDLPEDMLRELMQSGVNMGDVKSVPHILRTTLIAPYVDGVAFVHALRRKGGWGQVDKAWDRPPATTEQVLHIDKWEANEKPLEVPVPSANALGAGWKKEDDDSFGELGFALTFEEWMDGDDGRLAASGWGGDRSAVYAKGEELALAVHLRYDVGTPKPDTFSERALTKLSLAFKKNGQKPAILDATTVCLDRKDLGPLLFARTGRELVMLVGPAKPGKTAWSSTATCSSIKKWADEVLAQK